ncbi:MAG: glycosyltransferase, partial [Candidatus Lambdaproteobacteria bacterium]|nr:glycosyltransferase [Candidatus Lambdaproteobacteria bacterium]
RRIARLVTVSQVSAGEIARCFGVPPERIRVIHNGLDSALFRPRPHIARVPGRVLFVGNLQDPNKGGVYLLRAMGRLLAQRGAASPVHLLVVSGGIRHWDWLNGHIAAQGLRGRIAFKFKITPEELVDTYATAEVAVSPSVFEGFGFPAAEAMACGLPLVAARGGALPEVVGDAGVLVPARDSAALADALGALLDDPERRARLGVLGRARIVAHFRWEEAARQMVDFYREVIDAHHRF